MLNTLLLHVVIAAEPFLFWISKLLFYKYTLFFYTNWLCERRIKYEVVQATVRKRVLSLTFYIVPPFSKMDSYRKGDKSYCQRINIGINTTHTKLHPYYVYTSNMILYFRSLHNLQRGTPSYFIHILIILKISPTLSQYLIHIFFWSYWK